MTNINTSVIRARIENRACENALAAALRIRTLTPDVKQAISHYLLNEGALERGLRLILANSSKIRTSQDLFAAVACENRQSENFIPAKGLYKIIGFAAWLGGERTWEETCERALALGYAKTTKNGACGRIRWVMDAHLSLFVQALLNEDQRRRSRINAGKHVVLKAMRTADSFHCATDSRCNRDTPLSEMREELNAAIERGAGDFGVTTAGTQASQVKSTFRALGLTRTEKWTGEGVALNGSMIDLIRAAAAREPIPARMLSKGL